MKKNKSKFIFIVTAWILLAGIMILTILLLKPGREKKDPKYIAPTEQTQSQTEQVTEVTAEPEEVFSYSAEETEETKGFPKSVVSSHGILIDVGTGKILADKDAFQKMYPASMTKIFTVYVASKHITPEQLDDTVKISIEATDYSYSNDCSNTGYAVDEEVTVRDLFYGTILPSGADSAYSLACYVAGSHETFVDMMNKELEKMGLSKTTHFTNCVGIFNEEHYSTAYDIAMILKAASDDEFLRQVLGEHTYTTTKTKQHPDGITVSNWFLRRIEDKDTHGEVLCAKTGFVAQSGSCAASLAEDENGEEYICVTGGSTSSWRCIYDHVDIYDAFLPKTTKPTE